MIELGDILSIGLLLAVTIYFMFSCTDRGLKQYMTFGVGYIVLGMVLAVKGYMEVVKENFPQASILWDIGIGLLTLGALAVAEGLSMKKLLRGRGKPQ